MSATTIDEVIEQLEVIIESSKKDNSTLGYFAALYHTVTLQVKEKLGQNYFDDDARMEKLDVVFANRYLEAYENYRGAKAVTKSWEIAFNAAKNKRLIVLQHLLLGMNAHINLDLGIAAANVSKPETVVSLENDFNRINEILSSLVDEIQNDLAKIWPMLLKILKLVKKVDNFLVNFSMTIARDGAWEFANEFVNADVANQSTLIENRDSRIGEIAQLITKQGPLLRLVFLLIRLTERGTPADKITALQN